MELTKEKKEQRIKELIASNKIETAIIELKKLLLESKTEYFDEVISVQARFNDLEKKIRTNLIEHNQINLEKATIVDSVLKITNKVFDKPLASFPKSNISKKERKDYLKYLPLILLLVIPFISYQYFYSSKQDIKLVNNISTVDDSINTLSGKWNFILYYKACENNQKFPNNLQTKYVIDIEQKGSEVFGTGLKIKETFKGVTTDYSQKNSIEFKGTHNNGVIAIEFEETNNKNHKLTGVLNLTRSNSDLFSGSFELTDYNCKGSVHFRK